MREKIAFLAEVIIGAYPFLILKKIAASIRFFFHILVEMSNMNSYKLTFVSITIVLLFGCQRKIISASKIDNEIVTGKKVPVVASKYGFRKELIGGKYFLVPLSREDYDKFVAAWTKNPENKGIKFRTSQEIEASCYMYTTYACASSDGCQMCVLRNVSNYYFCECVQL